MLNIRSEMECEGMDKLDINGDEVTSKIQELILECGGLPGTYEADLIVQQIQTSLRLLFEGHNLGQLKLITRALKELRYAYRIFNDYPGTRRISIFGSARTPEDHPDYIMAHNFSIELAKHKWMSITGAANGIMKAGMAGLGPENAFGLSIRLPFEGPTNTFIEGDPKLIHFRYFFTRKLMFMSHSDAIAVFPGGVGTMDELFEMLTLIQTGKGNIIPIILMEGADGMYWRNWEEYMLKNLLGNGWISPEDVHFYHIAPTIEDGVQHVLQFYRRYHSSRYVKEQFVIRIKERLKPEDVAALSQKYARLIVSGEITQIDGPLEGEDEFPEMARLVFVHTRRDLGLMRQLIDEINQF